MVNQEILEGLRNALLKEHSMEEAMLSFWNSGYPKEEIEEAAAYLVQHPSTTPATSNTQPMHKEIKQPVKALPKPAQAKPLQKPNQTLEDKAMLTSKSPVVQKVSKYGEDKKPVQIKPVHTAPKPAAQPTPKPMPILASTTTTTSVTTTPEKSAEEDIEVKNGLLKKIVEKTQEQKPEPTPEERKILVSEYREKIEPKGNLTVIFLIVLLLILLGLLAGIIIFKNELIQFFNTLFN